MPPASILIQRRIEWSDTDASGHWHNTAAFRMFEWAETALFERLEMLEDVYGRLPRVHITAEFKELLRHRDVVDVELTVAAIGRSSITYAVVVRRDDLVCVRATVVASLLSDNGRPVSWPDEYRERLLHAGRQAPELLSIVE
jgi:YbgC/YbaW family acyl-CoA thioester hydrolase